MALRIDFADIQVCMLTHNEGLLLEQTLLAAGRLFPCFVFLDQSSTDNTVEIIKDILKDAATIIVEHEEYIKKIGFSGARNRISHICLKPWVFHLDADELVVSRSGATAVISEQAAASAQFLSVKRRNLGTSSELPWPLTSNEISQLPVISTEHHVRIHKNSSSFSWHSFIHEELWQDGCRVPHENPDCSLSLDHLSQFKGFRYAVFKEAYYAWMLLRGANFPAGDERALSDYSRHVLNERFEYFSDQALKYEELLRMK